jgi:hypothetical protein
MVKKPFLIFLIFSFSTQAMQRETVRQIVASAAEDSSLGFTQVQKNYIEDLVSKRINELSQTLSQNGQAASGDFAFNAVQTQAIREAFDNMSYSRGKSYKHCLELLEYGVMQKLEYSVFSKYLIVTCAKFVLSALQLGSFVYAFVYAWRGEGWLMLPCAGFFGLTVLACALYGKYVYDATPEIHKHEISRLIALLLAQDIIVESDLKKDTVFGNIKERVDEVFKSFKTGSWGFPYYPNPAVVLSEVLKMKSKTEETATLRR